MSKKPLVELDPIYIPANFYVSKSQAAGFLQMDKSTLQYHIDKGHVDTIHFPGLGHLIREEDVRGFTPAIQVKPSIYLNGLIHQLMNDEGITVAAATKRIESAITKWRKNKKVE